MPNGTAPAADHPRPGPQLCRGQAAVQVAVGVAVFPPE